MRAAQTSAVERRGQGTASGPGVNERDWLDRRARGPAGRHQAHLSPLGSCPIGKVGDVRETIAVIGTKLPRSGWAPRTDLGRFRRARATSGLQEMWFWHIGCVGLALLSGTLGFTGISAV